MRTTAARGPGARYWALTVLLAMACDSSKSESATDDLSDASDGGPDAGADTLTDDTSASDTFTSDTSVDDALTNDTPVDDTTTDTTSDGTASDDSAADDSNTDAAPSDDTLADDSNTDATSAHDAGVDASLEPAPTEDGCGAPASFELGLTPSRELFVDSNATGPGDGSAAAPFTQLESAFAELQPGTAVRIRPGTYQGGAFVSNAHGTAEAPIWIGGVPGEARPVISGGNNALQLSPASYLIVHHLELSGQSANGLNVDDGEVGSQASHHLVFRNLFVHDLGDGGNQDCLKLSGVSEHFVLDSEFRGCSGGSAIDHVGCQHGVIARNVFVDLTGNGVQSKGGSRDILITQNRFLNAGERAVNMGGSTGFEFFRPALVGGDVNFEAQDVRVIANLFRGGISPIAFVGCVECVAAHNTIIDPEHWIVRILQETTSTEEFDFAPAAQGRFVNNLVYYSRELLSTHVNVGPDTAPETFEFANNLWYAHDAPESSEPDALPVTESGGIYGQDPGLFDPTADDVSITQNSPAASAGADAYDANADLLGTCFATPPSVGAVEVSSER